MKKSMLSLLAVAAMVSCTQSDFDPAENATKGNEIRVSSFIPTLTSSNTRAPFEGTIGEDKPFKAQVYKTLVAGNYLTTTPAFSENGPITFKEGTGATHYPFDAPLYYPADVTAKVFLSGFYPEPSGTTWKITPSAATTATADIDGKTDLMATVTVDGTDHNATTFKETASTKAETQLETPVLPNLKFEHLLTLIKIKAIADPTSQAQSDATFTSWGAVTKLELTKVNGMATPLPASVSVSMKEGAAVSYKSGASKLNFYTLTPNATDPTKPTYTETPLPAKYPIPVSPSFPLDVATAAQYWAYSMIPPFVAAGDGTTTDLFFKVTTEKKTVPTEVNVKLNAPGGLRGKYITITFTFSASSITPSATVADWVDGGAGDTVIN